MYITLHLIILIGAILAPPPHKINLPPKKLGTRAGGFGGPLFCVLYKYKTFAPAHPDFPRKSEE